MTTRRLAVALSLLAGAAHAQDKTDPWLAVDQTMRAALEEQAVAGMGLAVYDRAGTRVFGRMYGDFAADRRVAIASASKMVTGVVLFRLVDEGLLSLDSTTGAVLGWPGERGAITLRHLLSFTSGMQREDVCTLLPQLTLASCVEMIERNPLEAPAGAVFDYGSTHLAVAGRMAEVVTGQPWDAIFGTRLRAPLGLPTDAQYYATPHQPVPTENPLLAGGLRMTMDEYARVLHLVFDKGRWQGQQLIAATLFDQQAVMPYPRAVVGHSPWPAGRYGLTAWLECATPQTGCSSISSPGAFGFTPFLDRDAGYYAVLGIELDRSDGDNFAPDLERTLKPLIAAAVERK
ncbi:MAG: serine hydrolase domain-containing protein [Vicinamibacteria bacterium]